jgi:hypothetical protein
MMMMKKKMIPVYSENHAKPTNKDSASLIGKVHGTCYFSALRGNISHNKKYRPMSNDWTRGEVVVSNMHVFRNLKEFTIIKNIASGPKAGMALVGHADASRHALLNTRKFPVYSTCRLCQQAQTLSLLVVVQGQCTMGCAADESGMEGGFSAP